MPFAKTASAAGGCPQESFAGIRYKGIGGSPRAQAGSFPMTNTVNMLLDVGVPISVQLGQTRMSIRDLLNLKKGSLVQLSRMAGEPVDVFIKDKMLAKGEITVVDDKLSVRIGQLYGEKEKFKHL
jgi:flagellar motor switch protein FliN/FliY